MEKSEQFLQDAFDALKQEKVDVYVGTRHYKVRQIAQAVKTRMVLLEQEAYVLEERGKKGLPQKEARRAAKKLYSLHSKKAAYYLLGNWALFVPGLFWLTWNILQLRGNETTFKIIEAGLTTTEMGFFKANWDTSRLERELYMRPVGEVAKEAQERVETVLNMLEKDALGTSQDDK